MLLRCLKVMQNTQTEKLAMAGSAKPGRPVIPIKILDNLNI